MSSCRSCHAPVLWATNVTTGKRMPLDPDPVPGGNVVLTSGNDGPEARVLTNAELERRDERARVLYVSHFSTCPQAGDWRRS